MQKMLQIETKLRESNQANNCPQLGQSDPTRPVASDPIGQISSEEGQFLA